jgi:hypothetical protein
MSNALENTVLLNLTLSSPGNTRKVDTGQVEVDADKDMLKLSKELWKSPEYDAVKSVLGEVRRWVQTKCLPASFIKGGFYILPLGLMETVTERLEEFRTQLEPLVETFCRMYETRKREAVDRLRELYDEDQYPPVAKIREAFGMTWKFLSVNVPNQLASVSVRHFEEAKAQAQRDWQAATDEIRSLLRESMRGLVAHMIDQLTPTPDGKRKRFYESTVSKFKEFMEDFPFRNLANDSELHQAVEQAQSLLNGATAEALRKGPSWYREQVRTGMDQLKERLDTMLEDVPERAITLDG